MMVRMQRSGGNKLNSLRIWLVLFCWSIRLRCWHLLKLMPFHQSSSVISWCSCQSESWCPCSNSISCCEECSCQCWNWSWEDIRRNQSFVYRSIDMRKIDDWSTAQSYEVEVAITKIESWKNQMRNIQNTLYTLQKNVRCFNLDENRLRESDEAFVNLKTEIQLIIENIEFVDESRCLFSQMNLKLQMLHFLPLVALQMKIIWNLREKWDIVSREIESEEKINQESTGKCWRDRLRGLFLKILRILSKLSSYWELSLVIPVDLWKQRKQSSWQLSQARKQATKSSQNTSGVVVVNGVVIERAWQWPVQIFVEYLTLEIFSLVSLAMSFLRNTNLNSSVMKMTHHSF